MAEVKWTLDQQKVIDLRNRNILVSAAAGSGKTAVLVERIISMISDEEKEVDIDHLLIVTFTKAAAAEMRERILQAIEKKLESMPDNMHLQKQITLIHNAQITTIHSFCKSVISNHFNVIDLDPSFRVGDDAELKLLQSDVMEEMLEDYYGEATEDFTTFVESYASGKSDAALEELILQLYHFSMSYPWPLDWLEGIKKSFDIVSLEELEQTEWMKELLLYIKAMTQDLASRNQQAIAICTEFGGPYMYEDALRSDEELIYSLLQATTYQDYANLLEGVKWARLSSKKDEAVLPQKKDSVKAIRDDIKKLIQDIGKSYFYQSEEEMLVDLQKVGPVMKVLIDLAIDFSERFARAKEERSLVDFSDLEHFALNILVRREDGEVVRSHVADDLSEYYEEILIDEYQDSNLVQETILTSISKERFGRNNLFMVGDVKQSIYKFRLARPELFMDKFHTYSTVDNDKQRIDLHQNFRSRAVVLNCTNYIFEQIMTKQLGNIEYDRDAALYPGASFEEYDGILSDSTEVILLTDDENLNSDAKADDDAGKDSVSEDGKSKEVALTKEEQEASKQEEEYTNRELEARVIGERIKQLVDPESGLHVWNKEKKCYEIARYKDIVILLRTMSGWSQTFVETLMAMGIPAYSDTQSGYFSSVEIRTILNMLRIVDNPRQDIPFTAILHSPMVGLTAMQLAIVRQSSKDTDMYGAAHAYCEHGEEEELKGKLSLFFESLERFRNRLSYTSLHELIWAIIQETGYYNYVAAMPAGERRRANIDMLLEQAVQYESTSYHGLFQFVRYIEKLHKYDIDYGEASTIGEEEDTVRIMSIHKSKGLEFPIVIVGGMGKPFNNQDARSKLVIHPDLGIGPDYVDPVARIKSPTLLKKLIQKKVVLENLAEELRVLYVAMTRAKEKLIMTGYVHKLAEKMTKWSDTRQQRQRTLYFQKLAQAGNYLDWLIPALARHDCMREILEYYGIESANQVSMPEPNGNECITPMEEATFLVKAIDIRSAIEREIIRMIEEESRKRELLSWDGTKIYDQTIHDEIRKRLDFQYPYSNEVGLHAKVTVSELKKLGQLVDEEESSHLFEEPEEIIPKFLLEQEPVKATRRGTIYHKVMECINLSGIHSVQDVKRELKLLTDRKILSEEEIAVVNGKHIADFAGTELAMRIEKAKQEGSIFLEQQFVISIKANEINPDLRSDEPVLVQGIIDCFFEEEGQIVIIDYKTDRLGGNDGEDVLRSRYKVQLDYYQRAVEQITGKKVSERILYSFYLGKAINL
ncbi:MAG TPA: UvrD-helicase domain-containing protein [Lachnospiraceae bacterium]|nr:UvrD-helicase domain-containing protein [Lachnospiraceae bacterium]